MFLVDIFVLLGQFLILDGFQVPVKRFMCVRRYSLSCFESHVCFDTQRVFKFIFVHTVCPYSVTVPVVVLI